MAFQPCARMGLDAKMVGRLKSLGCVWGDAAAYMPPRRVTFSSGSLKDGSVTYIGPGSAQWKLLPSAWSKHLVKDTGATRHQTLELFERSALADDGFMDKLLTLEGTRLMCHCSLGQRCHGDVLRKLFTRRVREAADSQSKLPPSDEVAFAAAADRRALQTQQRLKASLLERQWPSRAAGRGDPLFVGHGWQRRLLADGVGFCSPGMWPPSKRFPRPGSPH